MTLKRGLALARTTNAVPLAIALFIVDRFVHAGSFAIEAIVFLALWKVLAGALAGVVSLAQRTAAMKE